MPTVPKLVQLPTWCGGPWLLWHAAAAANTTTLSPQDRAIRIMAMASSKTHVSTREPVNRAKWGGSLGAKSDDWGR
jgi:hypothetical protein